MRNQVLIVLMAMFLLVVPAQAGIVGGESSYGAATGTIHVGVETNDDCLWEQLTITVGGSKDFLLDYPPSVWMMASTYRYNWCAQKIVELKSEYVPFSDKSITYHAGTIAVGDDIAVKLMDAEGNVTSTVSFTGTIVANNGGWWGGVSSKNTGENPQNKSRSEGVSTELTREAYVLGEIKVNGENIPMENVTGSVYVRTTKGWWQMEDSLPVPTE